MNTINLLPQEYVQERGQRRTNGLIAILFGIVSVSIGGAAVISERHLRHTREVCQRINTAYADAAKLIDEVHQLEAQKHRMLQKARMSAALMERLPRSYVLAMLTNALPTGAAVTSIGLDVKPVQLARQAKPPLPTKHGLIAAGAQKQRSAIAPDLEVTLRVQGKASTDVQVAQYIAALAKHPLTDMVDLSYSKEAHGAVAVRGKDGKDKQERAREFVLTVRLKVNADALDAMEPAPRRASDGAEVAGGSRQGGAS
jgi:Tfp pilus assembly protein PilN